MGMSVENPPCALCERQGLPLTRHHLVPRSQHKKKRVQKRFTKEQRQETILICRSCHNQLHASITEKELAERCYTLEAIMAHPKMQPFIQWIRGRTIHSKVNVKKPR